MTRIRFTWKTCKTCLWALVWALALPQAHGQQVILQHEYDNSDQEAQALLNNVNNEDDAPANGHSVTPRPKTQPAQGSTAPKALSRSLDCKQSKFICGGGVRGGAAEDCKLTDGGRVVALSALVASQRSGCNQAGVGYVLRSDGVKVEAGCRLEFACRLPVVAKPVVITKPAPTARIQAQPRVSETPGLRNGELDSAQTHASSTPIEEAPTVSTIASLVTNAFSDVDGLDEDDRLSFDSISDEKLFHTLMGEWERLLPQLPKKLLGSVEVDPKESYESLLARYVAQHQNPNAPPPLSSLASQLPVLKRARTKSPEDQAAIENAIANVNRAAQASSSSPTSSPVDPKLLAPKTSAQLKSLCDSFGDLPDGAAKINLIPLIRDSDLPEAAPMLLQIAATVGDVITRSEVFRAYFAATEKKKDLSRRKSK